MPGRKEAKKLPEREPFPGSPLPLLRRFWRATPTSNGESRDIGTFTLAAVHNIHICREGFRCSGEASARVITETRKLGIAALQRGQLVQFCPSLTMLTRAL